MDMDMDMHMCMCMCMHICACACCVSSHSSPSPQCERIHIDLPVRAAHAVQPPLPLLDTREARLVGRREHRPADPVGAEAVARLDLRRKPSWLRPRPAGAPQASFSASSHASGGPKLRPASANQPLVPHWPAIQALLSTLCSTVSSRRASGLLGSSKEAAVVKRARRLAAVQGKSQMGE